MPASIKLVLAATLFVFITAFGRADNLGRFGFQPGLNLPCCRITAAGIQPKFLTPFGLEFEKPLSGWKAVSANEFGTTVSLTSQAKCPDRLVANLLSFGIGLRFPTEVVFHYRTPVAPYLTWSDGSAGPGVPSPLTRWVLLSFAAAQPPVAILLPEGQAGSFQIDGKEGDWTISMPSGYKGWLRVGYPFGIEASKTDSAASLGRLVAQFEKVKPVCLAAPVHLLQSSVTGDDTSVTGWWKFSGPPLLPPLIHLAVVGGYPMDVQTQFHTLPIATEFGNVAQSEGNILSIRFPARSVPKGRGVTLATSGRSLLGTFSPFDFISIVEVSLELMRGDRDKEAPAQARRALQTYLAEAAFTEEPVTHQSVPFDQAGHGNQMVAAYGLLLQVLDQGAGLPGSNSLLTSIAWERDWLTWLPGNSDGAAAERRRAGAIAAIAACWMTSPAARLDGAMLEAGLAAERGLALSNFPENPCNFLEPLPALRNYLYSRRLPAPAPSLQLRSEIRILSDQPVVSTVAGNVVTLQFTARFTLAGKDQLVMTIPPGTKLTSGVNLKVISMTEKGGRQVIDFVPIAPGTVTFLVTLPKARRLPTPPDLPPYEEPLE